MVPVGVRSSAGYGLPLTSVSRRRNPARASTRPRRPQQGAPFLSPFPPPDGSVPVKPTTCSDPLPRAARELVHVTAEGLGGELDTVGHGRIRGHGLHQIRHGEMDPDGQANVAA